MLKLTNNNIIIQLRQNSGKGNGRSMKMKTASVGVGVFFQFFHLFLSFFFASFSHSFLFFINYFYIFSVLSFILSTILSFFIFYFFLSAWGLRSNHILFCWFKAFQSRNFVFVQVSVSTFCKVRCKSKFFDQKIAKQVLVVGNNILTDVAWILWKIVFP